MLKNSKVHALLFCAALGCVSLASCARMAQDDCAKHLGEIIHKGDSVDEAKSKLEACGFKTTVDREKSTLYGNKLKEGFPVTERTQILIRFDSNKRVTEFEWGSGLIGP